MSPIRVALAGSTGSIGTQALEVVAAEPGRYEVVGLAAGRGGPAFAEQIDRWRPSVVAVADPDERARISDRYRSIDVVADPGDIVEPADVVVNGVVGFAGLGVTIATLAAGKRLGLANKESLIAAGPVVQPLRATPGAELIPVDSEHCAIHQCLRSSHGFESVATDEVTRIVLTASGGPFRGRSAAELAEVTVDEALDHPTWSMGPKITIDSSTLMNKGLEVIEAHELFGVGYDLIHVVVHPQSIVHSMVEFTDGSTIAQLSMPDMRLPIGYALAWPQRTRTSFGQIDWTGIGRLDFEPPDRSAFRCLDLAYQAGRVGGSAPAWLSAANEVAVDAFLEGELRWRQIADVVAAVLNEHDGSVPGTVGDVIDADAVARSRARSVIANLTNP